MCVGPGFLPFFPCCSVFVLSRLELRTRLQRRWHPPQHSLHTHTHTHTHTKYYIVGLWLPVHLKRTRTHTHSVNNAFSSSNSIYSDKQPLPTHRSNQSSGFLQIEHHGNNSLTSTQQPLWCCQHVAHLLRNHRHLNLVTPASPGDLIHLLSPETVKGC